MGVSPAVSRSCDIWPRRKPPKRGKTEETVHGGRTAYMGLSFLCEVFAMPRRHLLVFLAATIVLSIVEVEVINR